VKPFAICRIVTSPYFAYSAYVWTTHFADEDSSAARRSAPAKFPEGKCTGFSSRMFGEKSGEFVEKSDFVTKT
jgi:hypothetical protein